MTLNLQWELFRPKLNYPKLPYHQVLAQAAGCFPEKTALIYNGQRLSFREVFSLTNCLSNALRDMGVAKGDRVALFMTNRPEFLLVWLACSKLGAVMTPMNPSYREKEAAYQLANSGAKIIFVQESVFPVISAAREGLTESLKRVVLIGDRLVPGTVLFSELLHRYPASPPPEVHIEPEEDLLVLPYSSGTTGLPKGVMLTHFNLVSNHIQFATSARLSGDDRTLIFLPFYHIYGSMIAGASLMTGATQIITERFQPDECLKLIEVNRPTVIPVVPPVLVAWSNDPRVNRKLFGSVRYMKSGAAPLAPEVARRVTEKTGVLIAQGYGLTECSPLTHVNPVDYPDLCRHDSVGLPVPDMEQRIVDLESGEELEPGQVGELVVRGPQVMKGYWKALEETAAVLNDGWFFTGDIAMVDDRGYVTITDRKKEMIKYKGFGIAPFELEAALFEHPAVADCAVTGKPDPEAGELPKAFVVLQDGALASSSELIEFVSGKLSGYKRIWEVEFVSSIPRNPSGKILRRVLREAERERAG